MPIPRIPFLLHLLIPAILSVLGLFAPVFASNEYNPPANYYATALGLRGDDLKAALHQIIRGHRIYPYSSSSTDTWDILKDADRDPSNPENVWLVYNAQSVNAAQEFNGGAGWNREHVWPQSLGGFDTNMGPGTDVHNLRACNILVNSRRSNLEFDYGGSPVTSNGLINTFADNDSFEPNDQFKGDVARIIFYMAVRYEGGGGEPDLELDDFTNGGVYTFGKLSSLLEWHLLDPVDDFERRRNARIFFYQGNRNPFIDNPEFVHALFQPDYEEPYLTISPVASQPIAGFSGGPFNPGTQSFSISNLSEDTVGLSITTTVPWLVPNTSTLWLSPTSQSSIQYSINSSAAPTTPGQYIGRIRVTDGETGFFVDHLVNLTVSSLVTDWFTRHFTSSLPFNLGNHSVTFTPDGSGNFYKVRIRAVNSLPTDPYDGARLLLSDDSFAEINLPPGKKLPFFGVEYSKAFIGSNGYITFATGDRSYTPSLTAHFNQPRISACFDDLNPSSVGEVHYRISDDRLTTTWVGVPRFFQDGSNTFQVEHFFDGRIRITWLGITVTSPLIGLSPGSGTPAGFQSTNFKAYPLELSALFEQWLAGHGLPVSGASDMDADPDGDGVSNWQEFAFGTSPVSGQGQQIESHFSDGQLTFRFHARSSGFNYTIENTSDLKLDFDDGNIPMAVSPIQFSVPPGYTKMEFTVPASGSGFYRVRARED